MFTVCASSNDSHDRITNILRRVGVQWKDLPASILLLAPRRSTISCKSFLLTHLFVGSSRQHGTCSEHMSFHLGTMSSLSHGDESSGIFFASPSPLNYSLLSPFLTRICTLHVVTIVDTPTISHTLTLQSSPRFLLSNCFPRVIAHNPQGKISVLWPLNTFSSV